MNKNQVLFLRMYFILLNINFKIIVNKTLQKKNKQIKQESLLYISNMLSIPHTRTYGETTLRTLTAKPHCVQLRRNHTAQS